MGGHLADIVLLDAAYGHKGQINVGHDPVEIFKAYGVNNVFLGLGGKIGPRLYSRLQQPRAPVRDYGWKGQ